MLAIVYDGWSVDVDGYDWPTTYFDERLRGYTPGAGEASESLRIGG